MRGEVVVDLLGVTLRCGSTEPGIAATASRNSRTSAVRMLVSCRQSCAAAPMPRGPARWRRRRRCRPLVDGGHSSVPGHRGRTWSAARSRKSPQPPVTRPGPTTISNAPPIRVTQRLLRRTARKTPSSLRKAEAEEHERHAEPQAVRDGQQHAPDPSDRCGGQAEHRAEGRADARAPSDSAKTAPRTGAPSSPAAGSLWTRNSRCSPGIRPRNARPSTMIRTPTTISTIRWWCQQARRAGDSSDREQREDDGEAGTNSAVPASTRPGSLRRAVRRPRRRRRPRGGRRRRGPRRGRRRPDRSRRTGSPAPAAGRTATGS